MSKDDAKGVRGNSLLFAIRFWCYINIDEKNIFIIPEKNPIFFSIIGETNRSYEEYQRKILNEFEKNSNADLIIFNMVNPYRKKRIIKKVIEHVKNEIENENKYLKSFVRA